MLFYIMLCAIGQYEPSTDCAALSMDLLLAQPSIDRAAPSVDGFGACRTDWHGPSCAFYHCFKLSVCAGGRVKVSYMHGCGKASGILVVLDTVFVSFTFSLKSDGVGHE